MGFLGGGGGGATVGDRFDVRRFGAVGDGATDDAPAIQRAIDAAQESGIERPTVTFPQGEYLLGHALSVTAPIHLVGEPATLRLAASVNDVMVQVIDGVRGGMRSLILDGAGEEQTGASPAVRLVNSAYFTLSDCTIRYAAGAGVEVVNHNASVLADEGRIERCYIQQNRGGGAWFRSTGDTLQGVGDWLIHGCHIDANADFGLRFDLGSFHVVSDCNLLSNGGPGLAASFNVGTVVVGCQIRNNAGEGIWLEDAEDGLIDGCQIHLNSRDGATPGIRLDRCRGVRVVGAYCGDAFIGPVRQTYGVQAADCRGLVLTGNVCRAADHATSGWDVSFDQVAEAASNLGYPDVGVDPGLQPENGYEYSLGLGRIQVPDAPSLAIGLSDFTLGLRVRLPQWRPANPVVLLDKAAGFTGFRWKLTSQGHLSLELGDGTSGFATFTSTAPLEVNASESASLGLVVDRDGWARFLVDGRSLGQAVDVSSHAAISLTSAAPLQIGSNGTTHDELQVTALYLFNRALSPVEAFDLARTGVAEADRWASFTPWKVSNFSAGTDGFGSSNGTLTGNVDGVSDGTVSYDDVLRFFCNASDINHRVNLTQAYLAHWHRFAFRYFIPAGTGLDGIAVTSSSEPGSHPDVHLLSTVGAWTAVSFELRRASGTSTQVWRWVARKSGAYTFAGANDSGQDLFYLRDVEVTALGCVLALDGTTDAVNHLQWQDASTNWNDGVVDSTGVSLLRGKSSGRVRSAFSLNGSHQVLGQACLPAGANPTAIALRKSGSSANRSVGSTSGGTQYVNAQSVGSNWSRPTQVTTIVNAGASSIYVTAADTDRTEIDVRYLVFG